MDNSATVPSHSCVSSCGLSSFSLFFWIRLLIRPACEFYHCIPGNPSTGPSVRQTTAVVPEVIQDGSPSVADVVENLTPRSMRSTFSGMWSRTLRVKVTDKNGASKLDIQIPVSFYALQPP